MQNIDMTEKSKTLEKKIIIIYKILKEILTFCDIEIEKSKFYRSKKDVDIDKVLVSNKTSSSEKNYKYFTGYLYNDPKFKLLHMFPKTSAYAKRYDGQTKWMCFWIEDGDLSEKYNTIWDKVSADKKNF